MIRTEWLVPFDSYHPHEQKPSINFMFGSLVRENQRKFQSDQIRVHPIGQYAQLVPARFYDPIEGNHSAIDENTAQSSAKLGIVQGQVIGGRRRRRRSEKKGRRRRKKKKNGRRKKNGEG
ncbi:hypothetical protein LINPERPRIM_LOCUS6526, partial [Linum perenne]